MTRYIHLMLEQRRHQIYCPHETCREALTLDECRYFLLAEIFEQWSAVMVEAEIPEALKVYCPFSDFSGLLVKESVGTLDVEEVEMAECPFCNRLFCARCKVPWHANLQCSEFQSLPTTDKTEADFLLLKLAEDHKWRRCGKCKSMVELIYGCNRITCRCSHYRRRCQIRAPSCNEVFDCRNCHNEAKNSMDVHPHDRHNVPRHEVRKVICSHCRTEQDVQQTCVTCGVCMGKYFCEKCNFFDDEDSKQQYHYDGCGICRYEYMLPTKVVRVLRRNSATRTYASRYADKDPATTINATLPFAPSHQVVKKNKANT